MPIIVPPAIVPDTEVRDNLSASVADINFNHSAAPFQPLISTVDERKQ